MDMNNYGDEIEKMEINQSSTESSTYTTSRTIKSSDEYSSETFSDFIALEVDKMVNQETIENDKVVNQESIEVDKVVNQETIEVDKVVNQKTIDEEVATVNKNNNERDL